MRTFRSIREWGHGTQWNGLLFYKYWIMFSFWDMIQNGMTPRSREGRPQRFSQNGQFEMLCIRMISHEFSAKNISPKNRWLSHRRELKQKIYIYIYTVFTCSTLAVNQDLANVIFHPQVEMTEPILWHPLNLPASFPLLLGRVYRFLNPYFFLS